MIFDYNTKPYKESDLQKHIPSWGKHTHWFFLQGPYNTDRHWENSFESFIIPISIWYNGQIKEYLFCPNNKFSQKAEEDFVNDFIENGIDDMTEHHYIKILNIYPPYSDGCSPVFISSKEDLVVFLNKLRRKTIRQARQNLKIAKSSFEKVLEYAMSTEPTSSSAYLGYRFSQTEYERLNKKIS